MRASHASGTGANHADGHFGAQSSALGTDVHPSGLVLAKMFTVVLGTGKKLFADGAIPMGFTVEKTSVSPSGVVIAAYQRGGEVKTGSF